MVSTAHDLRRFPVLLFDLDGVITRTAALHARAWKALFDSFLRAWGREHDQSLAPFDIEDDYVRHVDGRRRYDGVEAFLRSRGIHLPWGAPSDAPDRRTICGLGNAKNLHFAQQLLRHGVEPFDDTVALLGAARGWGARMAVVSASENCRAILERAGLLECFAVAVTGIEAAKLGLEGKPAADTFVQAARLLDVPPARCAVFEDAIAGVQAGRAGGFGLVVGVDRGGARDGLLAAGAHLVCDDLRALIPRASAS
jgi:HAD superfamily hydrolase (TIGR01509 family)